nr:complex I subunit 1 family protein [Armatimonas sp.]
MDIWQQLFVLPGDKIEWWAEVVRSVLRLVIALVGGLGSVPILVWLERRLLGWYQGRQGPNRVGPFGLLQPLADALKLITKEDITPTNVDKILYYMAPGVALAPVIMSLTVLPWSSSRDWGSVAPRLDSGGILLLLAIGSIEVYGVILAGWSSNNKYSLLGSLRAASQVISYELGMGLSILAVLLMAGQVSTIGIVQHQGVFELGPDGVNGYQIGESAYTWAPQAITSGFWNWHFLAFFPLGLIACGVYLISMLAETNRAPFDLPEAETELVAGFHTEYSSFKFAMFFMGEYANMGIVSAIAIVLFFGGYLAPWGPLGHLPMSVFGLPVWASLPGWLVDLSNTGIGILWLVIKWFTLIAFFITVRATLPRLRYDMLMKLGWKGIIPVALINLLLIALSMAIQQTKLSWFGHFVALVPGVLLLGALFLWKKSSYQTAEKEAKSTALVPAGESSNVAHLPIRREPVTMKMAPRVSED